MATPSVPDDGYDKELFDELDVADAAKNVRTSYGLVNGEPRLQDLQLRYLKVLMTHKNPYTGLRPVDDPGLAVVEFQNEDCIFFHMPLSNFPGGKYPKHAQAPSPEVVRLGHGEIQDRGRPEGRVEGPARGRLVREGRTGD